MTVFCRVVELGGFSATARELDMSGTMVSKHIAHLEKALGVSLLNRTTRKVSLTEVGREYYPRCKHLLDELHEIEDAVCRLSDLPRGLLTINAPVDFGGMHMASAIEIYQKAFPDVRIQLSLDNRNIDLNEGFFDLAIQITDQPDPNVIAKVIASTELGIFASPNYLKKHGEPKTIGALQSHRCLKYIGTPHGENWLFRGKSSVQHFKPQWHFASNNGGILCQFAAKGTGIVQVPNITAAPYVRAWALKEILTEYRVPGLPVFASYLQRRYPPIKITSFVKFLVGYFKQNPMCLI